VHILSVAVCNILSDTELEQFNASHPDLQTVPGTMILHQLFADSCHSQQVLYRDVSCFCSGVTAVCQCYDLQTFQFELPAAAPALTQWAKEEFAERLNSFIKRLCLYKPYFNVF